MVYDMCRPPNFSLDPNCDVIKQIPGKTYPLAWCMTCVTHLTVALTLTVM